MGGVGTPEPGKQGTKTTSTDTADPQASGDQTAAVDSKEAKTSNEAKTVEEKEAKPVVYDDSYTYADPEKVKMCALSFERCIGAQCNLDKEKYKYQLRLK